MPNPELMMVRIEWVDSRQPTKEWKFVSDLGYLKPCRCVSVGFLIRDDTEMKVLAGGIAGEGEDLQAIAVSVIPSQSVISIRHLVTPFSDSPND